MRAIFIYFLFFSLLWASSVDTKIKQSKRALSAKKIQYKKMDRELSSIAKKILMAKKEQKNLDAKVTTLASNIKKNEKKYQNLKKENKTLSKKLNKVSNSIVIKQDKFLELVAKNFSMSLALEELEHSTKKSVMMQEVYEVYAQNNNHELEGLKNDITQLEKKKIILQKKESSIKNLVQNYQNERQEYQVQKKKKEKIIVDLAKDKALYKKRFNRIKVGRRNLERKLAKLKIIKHDQTKVARAKRIEAQNRIEQEHQIKKNHIVVANSSSSTHSGKTISPLKGSRLIKKFGTYVDPIYKFKIFNKSITLKAPYTGAKVRSILKGKVVFAENSGGMLGKVVIVEHSNGIHTIYAKLSRLAPGIHVGKQLSRGTTIGKVDKSLMFEVTKNNKHINPLKLIHL